MPEGMTPEKPTGPEKPTFKSSWLVVSDDEFQKLRKGELGTVGKKIAMLHETGIANTLNANQLSTRAANWGEEAVEEGEDVWPELVPFFTRMTEKIQTEQKEPSKTKPGVTKVEVVEKIQKPEEETPEGWIKFVLTNLDLAEKESERKLLRTTEEEDSVWKLIDKALVAIPDSFGERYVPTDTLSKSFFEAKYPEGFYLKERLQLYVDARRHLNDRYIEISRANGSLTAMGLGKDDVPFEGISYKLQAINNEDWWAIFHGDEIFPELPVKKELAPNVSKASEKWLEIGATYKTLPKDLLAPEERAILSKIFANKEEFDDYYEDKDKDKKIKRKIDPQKFWPSPEDVFKVLGKGMLMPEIELYANIPTFENSRNVSEYLTEIRSRLRGSLVDKKSEDLAQRALSVWLTMALLDRNRSGVQGNSEDRDLMWSERKRVFELGEKEREPGVDWTVGRYFVSSPDQGSDIKEKDEKGQVYPKLKHRKDTLRFNAQRGVLVEKDSYFEGEVVSDFLHNSMIFVQDELSPGKAIRRNMASYVINADGSVKENGFKNIPYLRMGPAAYSGYFGYTLGKAKQISADMASISWKDPKEMMVDDFWNKKRDLVERMEHISPRFIIREFQARGSIIRELLLKDSRFDPTEVAKISGYSDSQDLNVISNSNLREEAHQLIKKAKINGKSIAKEAKDRADDFWTNQSAKIRMIHAMGQVWTGSLDGIDETSNLITASTITPRIMQLIITAITVSRYLEGEYLEHFKYEIWKEMGFGTKWGVGRRERYPNEVDPSLWE